MDSKYFPAPEYGGLSSDNSDDFSTPQSRRVEKHQRQSEDFAAQRRGRAFLQIVGCTQELDDLLIREQVRTPCLVWLRKTGWIRDKADRFAPLPVQTQVADDAHPAAPHGRGEMADGCGPQRKGLDCQIGRLSSKKPVQMNERGALVGISTSKCPLERQISRDEGAETRNKRISRFHGRTFDWAAAGSSMATSRRSSTWSLR